MMGWTSNHSNSTVTVLVLLIFKKIFFQGVGASEF
jgi:hypothetical protein